MKAMFTGKRSRLNIDRKHPTTPEIDAKCTVIAGEH